MADDEPRARVASEHSGGAIPMSAPAAVCGALLLPPGDARAPRWVARLSLPNPAYVAWLRHGKGSQPDKTVSPIVRQDGGPWKGGSLVDPR